MIIQDLNLNKQLFTAEELKTIETMLQSGQSKHIMSALINLDPEKEAELQRVMNKMNPIDDGFESEVRKQMDKKLPNGPQTPEEEAHWNRLLQEEYQTWLDIQEDKRKEVEESLQKKEVLKDVVTTTNDANVSPEVTGIPQRDIANELEIAIDKYKSIKDDSTKKEEIKLIKEEIKTLKKELDSNK